MGCDSVRTGDWERERDMTKWVEKNDPKKETPIKLIQKRGRDLVARLNIFVSHPTKRN
jgi:hypothetical protein